MTRKADTTRLSDAVYEFTNGTRPKDFARALDRHRHQLLMGLWLNWPRLKVKIRVFHDTGQQTVRLTACDREFLYRVMGSPLLYQNELQGPGADKLTEDHPVWRTLANIEPRKYRNLINTLDQLVIYNDQVPALEEFLRAKLSDPDGEVGRRIDHVLEAGAKLKRRNKHLSPTATARRLTPKFKLSFSAIQKILLGTYPASARLGKPSLAEYLRQHP